MNKLRACLLPISLALIVILAAITGWAGSTSKRKHEEDAKL